MITHVAIRSPSGEVRRLPKPHRHYDLLHGMLEDGISSKGWEQGFWDSVVGFVTRRSAYQIATVNGQLIRERQGAKILLSEDVW